MRIGDENWTPLLGAPYFNWVVERGIKLVTEASILVSGEQRTDGLIRTRLRSEQIIQINNTKYIVKYLIG